MEVLGTPRSTLQVRFKGGAEIEPYTLIESNGVIELEKAYDFEETVRPGTSEGGPVGIRYVNGTYSPLSITIDELNVGNVGLSATGRGSTADVRGFLLDALERLQNLEAISVTNGDLEYHEFPNTELRVRLEGDTENLFNSELQNLIDEIGKNFESEDFDVTADFGLFGVGFERTYSGKASQDWSVENIQELTALLTTRTLILGSPDPQNIGGGEFRVNADLPDEVLIEFVEDVERIMMS